ncbi:hypothetical protein GCM10007875_16170 [Limnobacter litoralis]|uniref:Uncharacterized protein n=1 Tax=Limnobacter litoralis TaxID=481366 RepID=A0ABQ5YSX4_9BURK|nr:hypothetical protein GCM10007875_16170 [Limnobacter litoralis]
MLKIRNCEHQTPGVYKLTCLDCCVQLVASTRPSKAHAQAMLEAINRVIGSPGRARILDALAKSLPRSDSQCQAPQSVKVDPNSQGGGNL